MATRISRREFVVGAAAGLTFAFAIDLGRAGRVVRAGAQSAGLSPNVWVTINPDDTVTIVSAAVEMGQGSMTGMPVVVAEELDADWSKVKVVPPPSNPVYGNPGFGGAQIIAASRTTRSFFMPLRLAGAQARRVLLDAVAAEWNVPVSELTTEPSVVVHQRSGRRISYGDVAKFAKVPAELPKMTPADLKRPSEFRLIGKSLPRVELPEKVVGRAKFGIDAEVPDMIYGAVLRPPIQGSAIEAVDDSAARAVPGVIDVIRLPWGVGVVGSGFEAVHKGKAALKVTWKKGARAESYDSDRLLGEYAGIAASLSRPGLELHKEGDVAKAMGASVQTFSAAYVSDHVYHATMEPVNALARVGADGMSCELWASTQSPGVNQRAIAGVLKTTPDKVKVNVQLLGGGFGRKVEQDFVLDAVLLTTSSARWPASSSRPASTPRAILRPGAIGSSAPRRWRACCRRSTRRSRARTRS
ncbi:MAG: hypothetical protein DMD91_20600 [Candidatus Rokuibacteriota bacterium]|nr:MAG: hypothetical protein DMD91_20600 [Candidatus Rokubacteria bacterium]